MQVSGFGVRLRTLVILTVLLHTVCYNTIHMKTKEISQFTLTLSPRLLSLSRALFVSLSSSSLSLVLYLLFNIFSVLCCLFELFFFFPSFCVLEYESNIYMFRYEP